jgi:hypothetical protein
VIETAKPTCIWTTKSDCCLKLDLIKMFVLICMDMTAANICIRTATLCACAQDGKFLMDLNEIFASLLSCWRIHLQPNCFCMSTFHRCRIFRFTVLYTHKNGFSFQVKELKFLFWGVARLVYRLR